MNSRDDYKMGYLWESDDLICYDVVNHPNWFDASYTIKVCNGELL